MFLDTMEATFSTRGKFALLAGLALAASLTVCHAENVDAEKLFASARELEIRAQKAHASAADKLRESHDLEISAKALQHSADIFTAQALQAAKADPNRLKAFQLRHEAQLKFANAHRRLASAHSSEMQVVKLKAAVLEMQKASAQLKDQPQLAQQMDTDVKTETAEIERLETFSAAEKTAAGHDEQRAEALWAEAKGLDRVFLDAGFEWRSAGCSMCVSMNQDMIAPQQRCVATSNRNFENRQGPRARTHLLSPAMAAAAAVTGAICDVRKLA
jgi:hypothetical protein